MVQLPKNPSFRDLSPQPFHIPWLHLDREFCRHFLMYLLSGSIIPVPWLSVDPPLEEPDDEQYQDTSDPTWDPSLPGKLLFLDFDPIIPAACIWCINHACICLDLPNPSHVFTLLPLNPQECLYHCFTTCRCYAQPCLELHAHTMLHSPNCFV